MSAPKRRVRRLDQPTGNCLSIVVRSLPSDTPEDIERMIVQATNGAPRRRSSTSSGWLSENCLPSAPLGQIGCFS